MALLWNLTSAAQRADAAELQIDWSAPPECASASELRVRVRQLLGGAAHPQVRASVEVTRAEHVYRAHVFVRSGSSFISNNDMRVHFGLGDTTKIDSVEVRWPSGLVETFSRVSADKFNELKEGSGLAAK